MPVKWTYVEYKGWRGKCKENWSFRFGNDIGMVRLSCYEQRIPESGRTVG